jgi:hypothetical protein
VATAARFGIELSRTLFETGSQLTQLGAGILDDMLAGFAPKACCPCCGIPEKECPARCACLLRWEGRAGQTLRGTVTVRNALCEPRDMTFACAPFVTAGGQTLPVNVSPAAATVQGGRSVAVSVQFPVVAAMTPGETYRTELVITGGHEQVVCLECTVVADTVCTCEVEHGERPRSVRAHQWYYHFQECHDCGCPPPSERADPKSRKRK